MKDMPWKLQELVKHLRQGLVAKGKRHLEPEKATAILWKALREINAGLQNFAKDAQAKLDAADDEREARVANAAAADEKLVELRQVLAERNRAVKDALKTIERTKAAIAAKRATRQSQEAEVKKVQGKKRHLEEVERESYEPLRRAAADGRAGQKQLAILRRTGKAFGFHKELLSIAPGILRKTLSARHSFDALIVCQLDNEFSKHVSSLEANGKNSEKAVLERTSEVREAEEELMEAKATHKKATQELSAAAVSLVEGRQALVAAKSCVRRLPADLKRAMSSAQKMEDRLLRFQRGPRGAFEQALGLEYGAVASIAEAPGNGVGDISMDIFALVSEIKTENTSR